MYWDDISLSDPLGPGGGQQFGYDGFGNLLSQAVIFGSSPFMSLTVNPNTNQVTGTGIVFDAAGNMTQDGGVSYGYDSMNRLTSAGTAPANSFLDRDCFNHDACYDQNGLTWLMNWDPFLPLSKQVALFKCNQALCTAAASLNSTDGDLVVDYFQLVPVGTCVGGLPSAIFHSIHPLAKSSVPAARPGLANKELPSVYDR